ncbi:MAG: 3'(2'),5'-bisphosphate nucleotidase CysQ [Robiginitomaculum sp.]
MGTGQNRADRALLIKAVFEAGKLARAHYELNESEVWNKSNNSPVTDADLAVNSFLQKALMSARPDYGWLSEETKDDGSRKSKRRVFVVDPIDGTRAFIKRKPHFVVSVAVIEDGKSVAGALYNPLTDEAFNAHLGGGASLNGRPITARDSEQIAAIDMIGYDFKFKALSWPDMHVQARNSMAYRIALVASAQAHATIAFTPKCDWDLAAASLIATEAGAAITDIDGEPLSFDGDSVINSGVICSGATLHPLLLSQVKRGPKPPKMN